MDIVAEKDIFKKYNAKPIWIDSKSRENCYVRFQTILDIDFPHSVDFYICADAKYELYINGSMAGFGQYEDYPDAKVYDIHNITEFLHSGQNLVSILAYSQGKSCSNHRAGLPMCIFMAKSGDKSVLVSNNKIKCDFAPEYISGDIENITLQRSFNFGFDLRKDDGWKGEYKCGSWNSAVECDDSAVTYFPRPVNKLELTEVSCGKIIAQGVFTPHSDGTVAEQMQYAALAHRDKADVLNTENNSVSIIKDNVFWISDLGEECGGYITLDVEADDGAIIDIAYGEHLSDMRVRSSVGGRNFAFRCVCRGGRQKISFYIKRLAGRYLEFFAHKGIKVIHLAGLHRVEYPTDFCGEVKISDRLFDKIYKVGIHTLKMCMHEHYEDCPMREQALYAMDSRNQMLAGYYAFGETKMPRASLELLAHGQKPDGLLELCAPARNKRTIPCFSLVWICALEEYALFSGDLDFVKGKKEVVSGIFDFFLSDAGDGLVPTPKGESHWNFYEWTQGMDNLEHSKDITYDAPLNCFLMLALLSYKKCCSWLKDYEGEKWCEEKYNMLCSKFHKTFYDEKKKAYKTYIGTAEHYSQLTQALALLAGCVPEEKEEQIRQTLLSDELIEVSLSHLIYKYDALMQQPEKYCDYVLKDIEDKWGYMLYSGATSFWETIDGAEDFDGAGSLCHGWSAVPVYIFWRYGMGIYPVDAGFESVRADILCDMGIKMQATLKAGKKIYNIEMENKRAKISKI